jgi:CRP/FNR family cyclic AMP-dependent transcriptional regulator
MAAINYELRNHPLFRDLNRAELAVMSQQLTRVTLPAGRVLVHEGEVGREFFLLVEGQAEVIQGGRVIATVGAGDHVGEMSLLKEGGRGTRNATVRALTEVVIYVSTRAEFRRIISVSSRVAEKVNQTASSRALAAA